MQTPKSRKSSSGAAPQISPHSISSEVSGKNSPRSAPSEASRKHSPHQLKTSPRFLEPTISSSNLATRASKDTSLRLSDHNSPASPLSEKKRPTKIAELESQISQLENDLKNVKDQLCSSEKSRKQAQRDAEESNLELSVLSSKLEESEKKFLELSASRNALTVELSETGEERDRSLQAELEALQKQLLQESASLASALDEIKRLKAQLEMVAESEANHSESARTELHNLNETLVVVEEMKKQLNDCKKSEAEAQELVGETLMQLEAAKMMVETLRSDGCKATGAYEAAANDLEQSRARVELLEELIGELNAEVEDKKAKESSFEADLVSVKLEVEQLRSALAVAEMRRNEDQARGAEQVKHAREIAEQIKSASGQREAELEAELRKSSYEIEELRSNLMDKETELQSIFEENDALIMQLENAISGHREHELREEIETIKAQYHDILKENRALRLEMEANNSMSNDAMSELEAARGAEREALVKVGSMTEEVDRSNRMAARVAEQLEAAQAASAEMEAELRRLKVQSDQWRKAAEVAASMLSVGSNGHAVERTGSLDNNYSPRMRRITSPYADDLDDELLKKKNVNVLRRFGVLWKKPQK